MSSSGRDEKSSSGNGVVGVAVNAIITIVKEFSAGAPPWLGALLSVAGIVAIVIVAVSAILQFPGSSEPWPVVCVVLGGLVVILAAILIFGRRDRTTTGQDDPPPSPRPVVTPWVRVVPRLPISDDAQRELRKGLENVRNAAIAWLAGNLKKSPFSDKNVRANVFLPNFNQTSSGDVCELFMPDRLRIGMDGHPDEKICFRPRQGLTGVVFIEQEDQFASTVEKRERQHGWDDVYQLTAEQERQIHPDLRWIVSLPLLIRYDKQQKAAGVLNVDGLEHELSLKQLTSLKVKLMGEVADFGEKLVALPKTRVAITLEDVSDG